MTPRLVLDTNVFVAAGFRRTSASRALVDRVRGGSLVLVWNEATRREAESVLRRIPPLRWDEVAGLFRPDGAFEGPTDPSAFEVVPDPDDRKFAALAHAAGCPLVSADDDLLGCPRIDGLDVLAPAEALRALNHASGRK